MGEIRKDNLHESLIEELNKLGNIDLSGKQDKTDESLLTESKDVIGAINELFQSANNGKELIANAIGEPLDNNDTFSAMSNDINGLLSTFKTNMMNNGITVESGDKFKQLIDKIATMAEEGSGKGIQFAEGACNVLYIHGGNYRAATIETNLDFTPNMIFATISVGGSYIYMGGNNVVINNLESTTFNVSEGQITLSISNVSAESFSVVGTKTHEYSGSSLQGYVTKWYAIGVGEEDTTLRDSLASILENKGVSVTEEDDMASLISKVGNEFSNIKELSLYNRGDMCDKITGGWSFESNMNSADYYIHEINEDHVYFWLRCNTDTGYVRMITNNLIDLTNYNSIFIEANGFVSETSSNHRVYIFLKSSDGTEVTLTDFLYPTSDTGSYSGKFINLADYKYLGNCYISVGLKMPRYASTNCQTGCNILKLMLSK